MRAWKQKLNAIARPARGIASRFRRLPTRKKVAVTALAGGVITLGLPYCWIAFSTRGRLFDAVGDVPERTVAIVPGAAVWASGQPSNALRYRLEAAAALYRGGRVSRILVSGDHGQTDYDEVNVMRRWLVRAGVPSDRVYLDHAGFRTLDTAARARAVFHVEDAVICTQPFHLPRAVFLALAHDVDAVGFAARAHRSDRFHDAAREAMARGLAVADVILGTEPKFYGPPIPITGPAAATHD